uniref:Apical junction component 1 homolog n=1 Tax=Tetraodon nigroviridis TaxID=99883 RepID=H3CBS6_TETNG
MTRTDLADKLLSTVHQNIKVIPIFPRYKQSEKCNSGHYCTLEISNIKARKRNCHTFGSKYRFSAPDIFSSKLTPQPTSADMAGEVPVSDQKRRTRSKSAPRVPTRVTAMPCEETSSSGRKGRGSQRASRESSWRPEMSPRRESSYASTRSHVHEVHPIKLQPQRSNIGKHSSHYVADNPDDGGPDKPATSPHVRCRMDIKPDESLLHYSRLSRTPTPTDSLGAENRMPSSSDYYGRERRAHSIPNVPTKFFYADDSSLLSGSTPHPQYKSYYPDERTPYTPKPGYPKAYSAHEPGQYIVQTPPSRIFYGDDPKSHQIQTAPPRFYFSRDMYPMPPAHHIPARAYYTEGRRHARVVQPQADDWYGSDVSCYSTNPASYVSQVTPTRVQQEPVLASWYANPCVEPQRMGTDSKSYSRSWDNILNSRVEREQPYSVQRGQSFDDLHEPRKPEAAVGDKPQPVVVNLSSSPRRYAALSMSDNSLIDKSPTETSKSAPGKHWFVTPEITITDNDIQPGKFNKIEGRSASWDVFDSRSADVPEQPDFETSTKETTHDNASLQQSLEQLDELLADLVTDYKPPSRRASEDILDQLKKLIDEEEAVSLSRKSSKVAAEEPAPLDRQPTSIRMNPDAFRDIDGASDAMKSVDECSPDQSPDEDDTMMCSNNKCRRTETLFNACLYFKSCHSCYTYYCSRNCRREDWDVHKESCLYGRIGSTCRHIIKHCRETVDVHKFFSRIAKVGYLSRGRGVLFLGFPNPASSSNFLQYGLDSLPMSPTYLSLRELESFKDNLGEYFKELREAGKEYDPNECFILNVSIAVGEQLPEGPSPRHQAPTVRKYAKVALASFSPERNVHKKESDMETLILTPPPGTADMDKEGEVGRKAREVCFINIQRELRIRGVFLRHEFPQVYQQLCEFVEDNRRFTPTTIYPIDKRTGKQFMCMIMAASEPRTLDWVGTPHLLDDIM